LELQIRTNTVVAVDLLRRQISNIVGREITAIEVDFWLWDEVKSWDEEEEGGKPSKGMLPFHRTKSIYY
jgi:hypothetical protein